MSKTSKEKSSGSESATAESPAIGLAPGRRAEVIDLLSAVLADQHVLYQKTRNFHWNLTGHRFHTLHEFFEKQYTELAEAIDQTAERIRMIGGVARAPWRNSSPWHR